MSCFGYVWSVVFGGTISVNEGTYHIVKRIGEGGENGRGWEREVREVRTGEGGENRRGWEMEVRMGGENGRGWEREVRTGGENGRGWEREVRTGEDGRGR